MKIKSVFLAMVLIACVFASCATSAGIQKVGNYSLSLPAEYEYHSAESMKAEEGCVGVFADPAKNLPELWIYSYPVDGQDLETFANGAKDFYKTNSELSFETHKVSGNSFNCVKIEYDEDWYDTKYYNYHHIIEMNDGTFMVLDFACDPEKDSADNAKAVDKILKQIGK